MRVPSRVAVVLLVLAAAAPPLAAVDWSKARPVTVVAAEYEFSPNELSFEHGIAYRLHLENHGKELHEFHAPEFFNASTLRNPKVLNADKTEIQIPPGATKDLYLVAPQPGHYPLYCPDHDWAGMTGEITVK